MRDERSPAPGAAPAASVVGAAALVTVALLSACAHGPRGAHRSAQVHAAERKPAAPRPTVTEESLAPAKDLLALGAEACLAKLDRVPLEVLTSSPTRGVRDPFRLVGSVEGVAFKPSWPTKRSEPSMEVVDCRLLLAFADAAPIFQRHGVKGIVYLSAYRPPTADLEASLRKSRHGAGMALDVGILERDDGTRWNVAKDFPKQLGRPPCEARQAEPEPGSPEDLRALVCDLAVSGLFSVVLTPNFDQAHHDHVHVELNPRVPGVYLR
jgi:hypothetical protein